MCGIIGFTGDLPAKDILIGGLEQLEYRGYDSAGIAVLEGLYLEGVEDGTYTLAAFPLKIEGVEAAPCRAVLIGETKGYY